MSKHKIWLSLILHKRYYESLANLRIYIYIRGGFFILRSNQRLTFWSVYISSPASSLLFIL